MMCKKIDFYQEVEVLSDSKKTQYRGLKGTVLGVSEENDVVYGYAVLIHGESQVVYFDKDEIVPTGVRFSRGDVY